MKVVCVTGVDGCGKSTQIAALTKMLDERNHTVQHVSIWDGLSSKPIREALPFPSRIHVYRYLRILTPKARAHFLFHALQVSLDLAARNVCDVLLIDGYWYKYYATEVAHGAGQADVRTMASSFQRPDRTFYLSVPPDEAFARKVRCTDYESGYGDGQQFLHFQRRSQFVLDALAAELKWTVLDGHGAPERITQTILEEILDEGAS